MISVKLIMDKRIDIIYHSLPQVFRDSSPVCLNRQSGYGDGTEEISGGES